MMRTLLTTLASLMVTTASAHAQPPREPSPATTDTAAPAATADPAVETWDAEVSDVDKFRTPDAPAFEILGAAPTEIQHPTTPTELAIALGGIVSGGDLSIPRSLAIEVAPYWLVPHPGLTVDAYRRENLLRPLRTLSLSIATTQTQRSDAADPSVKHTDADVGVGFRTMLLQWGAEDPCTAAAREFADVVNRGMLFSAAEQQELAGAGAPGSEAWNARRVQIEQRKQAAITAAEAALKKLQSDTCLALAASTTGFSLDLAGAIDVHAADARLTQAATSLAGYALWTNLAYDTSRFSGIAVARITERRDAMPSRQLLDAGLRGIFKQKNYGISAELLVRRIRGDAADTTYRADLGVEYKLTGDTWLSVTLGRGFALAPGDAGAWFSLANLQWSFGKPSF